MTSRKRTPPEIETEVLTQSARRCCICFGLQFDLSTKQGQIAHLDGDPSNFDFDNLAFLCLAHHDEYDTRTSQSKGLTIHETKQYRTLLYQAIRQFRGDLESNDERKTEKSNTNHLRDEVSVLLSHLQSRSWRLSECIAQGLILAQKTNSTQFITFCRNELSGYSLKEPSPPDYRVIDVFCSTTARINTQSFLWINGADTIFDFMRQETKHYTPARFFLTAPISSIENAALGSSSSTGIITFSFRHGDVISESKNPDLMVTAYAHPRDYRLLVEGVQRELTVYLLDLLPCLKSAEKSNENASA